MPDPRRSASILAHQDAQIRHEVFDSIPDLGSAVNLLHAQLPFWNAALTSSHRPALIRLGHQANNDYLDVLMQSLGGNGRAAIRAARSLFEILVAISDLVADPSLDEQFLDHEAMTGLAAARLDWGTNLLSGKVRKAAEHHLHKQRRDAEKNVREISGKYGPTFRRQWHPATLYDRAEAHGLLDEYDFYRLSSAVVHGSAAGNIGLVHDDPQHTIHRTGPALSICPIALLHGNRYFARAVSALEPTLEHPVPEGFRAVMLLVEELWPQFWEWVREADERLWPDGEEIVNVLSVLVVGPPPRCRRTWYAYNLNLQRVVEADPPAMDAAAEQYLDESVIEIDAANVGRTQPVSIVVPGVAALPRPGEWRPAGEILVQPELTIGPKQPLTTLPGIGHDPRLHG